jgi:hypothetical protein
LTNSTRDDLDRPTSGRFVRNLALSLSGGALVTLLGATAAHAQDASNAGTNSAGVGQTGTGDATAVGNQSGTNTTQTVTVSGNLGTIQVINQQANVTNTGSAFANTGGNIAIGNASNNTAGATQNGVGGTGAASNNGQAANGSNGSATITTGNASAIGNSSNTNINQEAHGDAHGQLGGILVINQSANVTNSGVALANSGGNGALGNASDNNAGLLQTGNLAGGIAANDGKATNTSDGKATINTGNSSATGNKSETSVTQSATGSAGGELGGIVLINQTSNVLNTGAAVANSGLNGAAGNLSTNGADAEQHVGPPLGGAGDDIAIGSNNGEASNWSGGSASVGTGNASAVGNDSTTNVTQRASSDITGTGGLSLITQNSNVDNIGIAAANSGGNIALGNASDNGDEADPGAGIFQTAPTAGGSAVGVLGNFGLAQNTSDGSGNVGTGSASAAGNRAQTNVSQAATTNGGDFNLYTQTNDVENVGFGLANSGLNASVGNISSSGATTDQRASLPDDDSDIGVGVLGNFGKADNSSNGSASITTGNASAVGNQSQTNIGQEIDPDGLVVPVQTSAVVNAGVGIANSGGNFALGNASDNNASETQRARVGSGNGGTVDIDAGTLVASNNGEASNSSDGTASIATGNASATGNESSTTIDQSSTGQVDGLGLVVNTQAALVTNTGIGVANSGGNVALGNLSQNDSTADQRVRVGSGNDDVDIDAGILTATNSGTAANASDGTADIRTGNASATGNRSATRVSQDEGGSVSGLGGIINTQAAVVVNAGAGIANSGGNLALGNDSNNGNTLTQRALIGSGNGGDVDITALSISAANSGEASNSSDGTARIATGSADATGNSSSTDLNQRETGDVGGLGLVLNTQVGGVANVGLGVANSGGNIALGNVSDNDGDGEGAHLDQRALVGSNNDGDADLLVFGPVLSANAGEASNSSDGTADIRTGGAQGQGNVSTTSLNQSQDGSIDNLGLAVNTQAGGVLNAGVGVANSGLNAAVGNASTNAANIVGPNGGAGQRARVGSGTGGDADITVLGPLTANNSGTASNSSGGTAKVGTGGALASGNVSATTLSQHQTSDVTGLGLDVSTQVGGVANVGLGIANSGLNAAIGNASGTIDPTTGGAGTPNSATTVQRADFDSGAGAPGDVVVIGPLAANNSGEATNSSDGTACVCTGNAVASGNVSTTTLVQDLDTSVGTGTVILTEAGGVLNAGVGLANSGLNLAIGNISQNTATATQTSTNNVDPLGGVFVGPQIVHNGGGATNASAGTGKVGTGNASGTGNQSTTNFVQAAAADSDFAVANITGGTTNTGLGLANSGLNLGIGNASVNDATLTQTADGAGIVSNDGTASNNSDGFGGVGNPDCEVPGTPGTPGLPGVSTPGKGELPHTGAPIEVEAAIGLMLLLAGFGLRRKGQALA